MTAGPASTTDFDWNEFIGRFEFVPPSCRPSRKGVGILVLLLFGYCACAFFKTEPPRPVLSELEAFLRKYLSQTGGCQHIFYRTHHPRADWLVYGQPDAAIHKEPVATCFALIGRKRHLALYQFSKRRGSYFEADDVLKHGREIDSHDFQDPVTIQENDNSRVFSYLEETHIKFWRGLVVSEGNRPCTEVSITLTETRFPFLFNQQQTDAKVTCEGRPHIPLDKWTATPGPLSASLVWSYQRVHYPQKVSLSLADCQEGRITVQPPAGFWLQVAASRVNAFLSDSWASLALSLLGLALAFLVFERCKFRARRHPDSAQRMLEGIHRSQKARRAEV